MKIAIIPARGNSVRLPRKNILPLDGRPILSYPIAAARRSGLFDQIVVSTEDPEIRDIAANCGATVMGRPAALTRDTATVSDVCKFVVDHMKPDIFCCLYATAAMITARHIMESPTLLEEADGVMGIAPLPKTAFQAMTTADGFLTPLLPAYIRRQSQDWPVLTASNGTLYWYRASSSWHEDRFYIPRLRGYETPGIDLDTHADYQRLRASFGSSDIPEYGRV